MKTNELTGLALDWAVAKCFFNDCEGWDGTLAGVDAVSDLEGGLYRPSIDWAQGGEIIEREKIELSYDDAIGWTAAYMDVRGLVECIGSTPLVAAMRCYVASKLGDNVDILDHLGE